MTRKKRERQIWVDREFAESLKRIKGNRLSKMGTECSYGKLTREMANTEGFRKLERQLSTELITLDEAFIRGLRTFRRGKVR